MSVTNSRGIVDVVNVDDSYFTLNGELCPKVWQAFPLRDAPGALLASNGVHVHALLGSSVDGIRPTTPAALVLAMNSAISSGARYYVDSASGDDEAAGSEAAPFQTIAKAKSVLGNGVRIHLKCGSHWREELNIGNYSRVAVIAYGEGEKPLLDASDIIASGSWTKTAGLTNVYQQTLGLNNVASGFLSVWEDAARLTRATSAALCDSSPGSMYASTDNGTSTTIYIHPTGSSNPTSNGKVYEYSARNYGLGGRGADYLTVRGIATRRNANIGGSLWTGRYARIVDCKASDGNNHCLQYKDGSYLERVTAEDCYYTLDQPTHFVCYEDVPIGLGVQHVKCVARQNGAQPTAYGFFAHRSSGGHFGTITYDDCEVVNIVRGWGGSSAFFVVNDPIYSGTLGAAFFLGGEADFTINRGSYTGLQNLVRAAMGDDQRVTLNAVTAASANSTLSFGTGVDRVRLSINGSDLTELNTDAGSTAVVIIQGVDATLISRGNRLRAGSNHYPYFTSTGTVLDSDNNAFRSGNRFRINGVTYNDFAAYRAAFPTQDANSTSTAI